MDIFYDFPDNALLVLLVDAYFTHVNHFLPLLHRPTFERDINAQLHLHNRGFGSVLLLVCALASRHLDDLRVFADQSQPRSAGWQWYNQIPLNNKSFRDRPSLFDIQTYAVRLSYHRFSLSHALIFSSLSVLPNQVKPLKGTGQTSELRFAWLKMLAHIDINHQRISQQRRKTSFGSVLSGNRHPTAEGYFTHDSIA